MTDFRRQLKDQRQIEKEQDLEDRLDRAIGKDLDATLVPNFMPRGPRETEEVYPALSDLKLDSMDRVNFTSLCEALADMVLEQAELNARRREVMHEAKKIAYRSGVSKVEVNGHKFRLWTI